MKTLTNWIYGVLISSRLLGHLGKYRLCKGSCMRCNSQIHTPTP